MKPPRTIHRPYRVFVTNKDDILSAKQGDLLWGKLRQHLDAGRSVNVAVDALVGWRWQELDEKGRPLLVHGEPVTHGPYTEREHADREAWAGTCCEIPWYKSSDCIPAPMSGPLLVMRNTSEGVSLDVVGQLPPDAVLWRWLLLPPGDFISWPALHSELDKG